jgi:hypothetical protein
MAHDYDRPDLSPEEFQKAVMHDPTVPMELRLRAAEDLRGVPRSTVFDPVITIRIGGIPEYDYSSTPCEDINDCISRTTPCPWAAIIRSKQGVRFTSCKRRCST